MNARSLLSAVCRGLVENVADQLPSHLKARHGHVFAGGNAMVSGESGCQNPLKINSIFQLQRPSNACVLLLSISYKHLVILLVAVLQKVLLCYVDVFMVENGTVVENKEKIMVD